MLTNFQLSRYLCETRRLIESLPGVWKVSICFHGNVFKGWPDVFEFVTYEIRIKLRNLEPGNLGLIRPLFRQHGGDLGPHDVVQPVPRA